MLVNCYFCLYRPAIASVYASQLLLHLSLLFIPINRYFQCLTLNPIALRKAKIAYNFAILAFLSGIGLNHQEMYICKISKNVPYLSELYHIEKTRIKGQTVDHKLTRLDLQCLPSMF